VLLSFTGQRRQHLRSLCGLSQTTRQFSERRMYCFLFLFLLFLLLLLSHSSDNSLSSLSPPSPLPPSPSLLSLSFLSLVISFASTSILDLPNTKSERPLHLACRAMDSDAIASLIRCGASLAVQGKREGEEGVLFSICLDF